MNSEPASSFDPFHLVRAGLDGERRTLEAAWGDGHTSRYQLPYLRSRCPCAVCREDRQKAPDAAGAFKILAPGAGRAHELKGAEPVGSYGMKLTWADGHSTGIYTWEYLRRNCPCEECRRDYAQEDTPAVHGIHIP